MKTLVKALNIIQVGGYFSYAQVCILIIIIVIELSKHQLCNYRKRTISIPAIKLILWICVLRLWYFKYFQNEDEPFTEVFFVSSTRDVATMDWTMECEENIDLPVSHMTITWLTSYTYIYVMWLSFGKFPIDWSSWNSSTKTSWRWSLTVTLRTTTRSGCGLEWWA